MMLGASIAWALTGIRSITCHALTVFKRPYFLLESDFQTSQTLESITVASKGKRIRIIQDKYQNNAIEAI